MFRRLRSWGAGRLFLVWGVYWLALVAVGLGPAIPAAWRATHSGEGASIGANFGNGGFTLGVWLHGERLWSGSIGFLTLALLVAGPPLLLWVAWMSQRPSRALHSQL